MVLLLAIFSLNHYFMACPKAEKSSFSTLYIVISSHIILQFAAEKLNDMSMYAV